MIRNDLRSIHLTSVDDAATRVLCRFHYGVKLRTQEGNRKIFFLKHSDMLEWIDAVIEAQGFPHGRLQQYRPFQESEMDLREKVMASGSMKSSQSSIEHRFTG